MNKGQIRVLVFDVKGKYHMLQEWTNKVRNLNLVYCYDPERAFDQIKRGTVDILVLGGDPASDEFKAPRLLGLVRNDMGLGALPFTYITTWNEDEARLLRSMLPDSLYIPFCQSFANMLVVKARNMKLQKGRKS